MNFRLSILLAILAVGSGALLFTSFERPSPTSVQAGFRGTGMAQVYNPRIVSAGMELNRVPEPQPPQDPAGQLSSEVYQNVQVLGDLDANEFLRLMAAITEWVSPEQGCAYCHAEGEELSADTLYTKVVARKMLQMTRDLNQNWKQHVGETGVTCHTCHRGKPVPANIWFADPGPAQAQGAVGNRAGQNAPAPSVGLASLPYDPFEPYLGKGENIRVASPTALPDGNRTSIKQTEGTYALMMHMSGALGVNCTFCHNSRAFDDWRQSSPQRVSAWHGIRMVRNLNMTYLDPLQPQFPRERLGPLQDAPKVNCATCHQGAFKPFYGASMLKDYPYLGVLPPAAARAASAQ